MELSTYLSKTSTSREEFAAALGVSPVSVYRWEKGDRFPIRHLAEIAELTKGKVTANDFVKVDA
jgi:transcriptional regulator with XRE-family HTH domain